MSIQNLNAQIMTMKEREYLLLEAISQDEAATQAGLAARLGIAVGSVNWYIKRLISRGYLKATRMDRTRLMYNLTLEGMNELKRRAAQYLKASLVLYKELRQAARGIIREMEAREVAQVYIYGDGEVMDIMRLTCLETGVGLDEAPAKWGISNSGGRYTLRDLAKDGEVVDES